MNKIHFLIFLCTLFQSCGINNQESVVNNLLNVSLRMEVHVVDSLYPIYSIPRTKTYLYTYQQTSDGKIFNEQYSDTTTCPNGWAVKELFYELEKRDQVYLGATIKFPPQGKYQFDSVSYNELKRFENEGDTIRFVKTFTVFQ